MAQDNDKSKSFLARAVISLGAVALVFIMIAIYREMAQRKQIQDKIKQLQQEAEQIGRSNALVQDRIAYLESRDYQEREAKDKLNLQSPDEQTVIIKPTIADKIDIQKEELPAAPTVAPQLPNPTKWWNYYFKY